jgi:hypothetical protein
MLMLVPNDIRHQFKGELMAERVDMRERGWQPWRVNVVTAGIVFAGIAQHVPLSRIDANAALQPEVADRAATVGWILWRFCGPALFLGYTLGNGWLALVGGLALLGTFGCIAAVVAKGREPYDNTEARLLNGVFGGIVAWSSSSSCSWERCASPAGSRASGSPSAWCATSSWSCSGTSGRRRWPRT